MARSTNRVIVAPRHVTRPTCQPGVPLEGGTGRSLRLLEALIDLVHQVASDRRSGTVYIPAGAFLRRACRKSGVLSPGVQPEQRRRPGMTGGRRSFRSGGAVPVG